MRHLEALLTFAKIRGASVEQRADLEQEVKQCASHVGWSVEDTARWVYRELYPYGETIREQAILQVMPQIEEARQGTYT